LGATDDRPRRARPSGPASIERVWDDQETARAGGSTDLVTVTFMTPPAIGGQFAELVGEFTSWVPLPMDRRRDGGFVMALRLDAGRSWRYRFLIDGDRWMNDWSADDYEMVEDGSCMSVIRT
jgi:hypothetical protein